MHPMRWFRGFLTAVLLIGLSPAPFAWSEDEDEEAPVEEAPAEETPEEPPPEEEPSPEPPKEEDAAPENEGAKGGKTEDARTEDAGKSDEAKCSKCRGRGQVTCKKHASLNMGGLKVGDFDCADCLDLPCCRGVGWVPCPKCKDADGKARWQAALDEKTASCKELAEVVEKQWMNAEKLAFVRERRARKKGGGGTLGEAVPRAFVNVMRAPHLILVTDIPGRRVALQRKGPLTALDTHQVHHLYMARAAGVFQDAVDLHRPGAFDGKPAPRNPKPLRVHALRGVGSHLFIWANEEAQRALTASLFEHETPGPLTGGGATSVWDGPGLFSTDNDLYRYVYASVAGQIVNQYNDDPTRTREDRKDDEGLPVWITEGFQHVLEIRRWGVCEESGVQESKKVDPKRGAAEGWNPDHWGKEVGKLLGKGRARPFPELSRMVYDDMQCSEHMVAWSMVDFLLRQGMDKLGQLTPLLRKKGSDQAAALRQVYGMTQAELEDKWKTFVARQP